jgi:peptidyl-tRNA hydrolase
LGGCGSASVATARWWPLLSTFSRDEEELAREAIMTAADAVEAWLADGVEEAMNAFNGVDLDELPAGP